VSCLGVHFALSSAHEATLLGHWPSEGALLDFIINELEETLGDGWSCETDKAWDCLHRLFNDGELNYRLEAPLQGVVLGGRPLYTAEDYIASYKSAEQVKEIAAAVECVSGDELRRRYDVLDPKLYGFDKSEEDFAYTVGWFIPLQGFFRKAADAGRAVVFTADQ
jgi:hypothetical protein